MKQIPETEHALVLRTDFSDHRAWNMVCEEIRQPAGEFRFVAYVDFLDDREYEDITSDQLLGLISPNYKHSFIIVADRITITHPEHPLLIIELYERSGRKFRTVPSQIQGIENNLSIANMDFEEFAERVDEDGIFRGFPEP
jgi:hypothetical protein